MTCETNERCPCRRWSAGHRCRIPKRRTPPPIPYPLWWKKEEKKTKTKTKKSGRGEAKKKKKTKKKKRPSPMHSSFHRSVMPLLPFQRPRSFLSSLAPAMVDSMGSTNDLLSCIRMRLLLRLPIPPPAFRGGRWRQKGMTRGIPTHRKRYTPNMSAARSSPFLPPPPPPLLLLLPLSKSPSSIFPCSFVRCTSLARDPLYRFLFPQ